MRRVDVRLQEPTQYRSGDKLRSVVRSQVLRAAVNADQFAQHFDDPSGSDAASYVDRQALPSELIDHGETLELLAVGAGVEHKVIGPYLAHSHRCQRPWARDRYTPAWPFSRHLQLVQPPKAVRSIRTHGVTAAREEDLDASIAIPGVLRRQLVHHSDRRRISLRQARLVTDGRSRHAQQRARSPYRSTPLADVGDLLPAHGRAHHFFAATSFRISMSMTRSASTFLSRAFSASRWRSRFTSTASSCPKRLRQA